MPFFPFPNPSLSNCYLFLRNKNTGQISAFRSSFQSSLVLPRGLLSGWKGSAGLAIRRKWKIPEVNDFQPLSSQYLPFCFPLGTERQWTAFCGEEICVSGKLFREEKKRRTTNTTRNMDDRNLAGLRG